ncbi:hypothetical protein NDA01_11545 [Trichocoleus desertorum AS-A10]|uniref:hypothetical protein n=1 Tax=Trichocoleus desertorum TaxID=1481672 RepID=UPI003297F781
MTDLPYWLKYLVEGTHAVFSVDAVYEDNYFILWALLEPYPKLDVFCKLTKGVQLMVVVYPNTHEYKLDFEYNNLSLWETRDSEEPAVKPIGTFQEFFKCLNELVFIAEELGWTSEKYV